MLEKLEFHHSASALIFVAIGYLCEHTPLTHPPLICPNELTAFANKLEVCVFAPLTLLNLNLRHPWHLHRRLHPLPRSRPALF